MAKFVQIQSNTTIKVTTGLQNKDVTNPDAHVPDRLKVNPEWPKAQILIRQGVHRYPVEISEWPTVKALAKDKVLTIGAISDVEDLTDDEKVMLNVVTDAVEEFKMPIIANVKKVENNTRTKKSIALADLADEKE